MFKVVGDVQAAVATCNSTEAGRPAARCTTARRLRLSSIGSTWPTSMKSLSLRSGPREYPGIDLREFLIITLSLYNMEPELLVILGTVEIDT